MKRHVSKLLLGSTALTLSMSFYPLQDCKAYNGTCSNPVATWDSTLLEGVTRNPTSLVLSQSEISKFGEELVRASSQKRDTILAQKEIKLVTKPAVEGGRNNEDDGVDAFSTSDNQREMIAGMSLVMTSDSLASLKSQFAEEERAKAPKNTIATFHIDDVMLAADMVEASYEFAMHDSDFPAADQLRQKGYRIQYFGENDKDGGIFATHANGTAYLVFRGSANTNNWLQNANLWNITTENGGKYHRGFYSAYNNTATQVWAMIDQFARTNNLTRHDAVDRLVVTGHSRGAAAATVAADQIRRETGVAPRTVTFEAPRALHKYTAAEYENAAGDRTLNVTQGNDPVHYVNLAAFAGDAHVGQRLYLPLDRQQFPHVITGFKNALQATANGHSAEGHQFQAAPHSGRDLAAEEDHSVQAYVERAAYVVTHPISATAMGVKATAKTAYNTIRHPIDTAKDAGARVASVAKAATTPVKHAANATRFTVKKAISGATSAVKSAAQWTWSALKRPFVG